MSKLPRVTGALSVVFCLTLTACVSRVSVRPVTEGGNGVRPKLDGVFYALPRTVVTVETALKRTAVEPGRYAAFTPFFFPGKEYAQQATQSFELQDPISISSRAEPDPDAIFMVKVRGHYFEDKVLNLTTVDGILTDGTAQATAKGQDVALAAVGAVANILGTVIARKPPSRSALESSTRARYANRAGGTKAARQAEERREAFRGGLRESLERRCFEQLDGAAQDFYMRELLSHERDFFCSLSEEERAFFQSLAGRVERDFYLCTLTPHERADYRALASHDYRERYFKLQNAAERALFVEAADAYEKIAQYQEQYGDLLLDATVPADTLALQRQELKAALADLLARFFGKKKEEVWTARFEYLPPKRGQPVPGSRPRVLPPAAQMQPLLLAFSPQAGVCETGTEQDVAVPADFKVASTRRPACPDRQEIRLAVTLRRTPGSTDAQFAEQITAADFDETGARGFYYRVPAVAVAKVMIGEAGYLAERQRATLPVAQLGTIKSLPQSSGGRETKYVVSLDAAGGLKNFQLGKTALVDKAVIDELAKTSQTLLDANDELKRLERRKQILEAMVGIRAQEKLLNPQQ
jgi:hypothetical protein